MIRLTKLRMKNFKSFKQATVPFVNGFTAIAGANGSGKSNIMDAVLFALGETSLKSIRASRLTDLVHSATTGGENYAVVNLSFEGNNQNYELSRMIDKQGKSVYRLDDKRVTLSEIQNLLGELGIRVDGHNLVSQGDLLRFIDMNPVERRKVIDEVAGLQEFEEKKNEAMKDLDKVDRKIKDVTIVLNERMAVIEQLGKERDIAKRFQEREKELKETKRTILHVESVTLNQKLEHLVQKQVELIEKKDESQTKQEEIRLSIVELEKELSELDAKVLNVKNQAFQGLGKSVEEQKAEIRVLEERVASGKQSLESLRWQSEELERIEKRAQEETVTLSQEWKTIEEKIATIESELAPLRKKQEHALQKKVEILADAEKMEKEVNAAREIVNHARERIAQNMAKMDSIHKEKEMGTHVLSRLENRHSLVGGELSLVQKEARDLINAGKKHGNMADAIASIQKKAEELDHHLAEHTGIVLSHTESLEQLKKVKSHCPICARELQEALKKKLSEEKEKGRVTSQQRIAELKGEKETLHQEWDELRKLSVRMESLVGLQSKEKELKSELSSIETEKKEMESRLEKLDTKHLAGEKQSLEHELSEKKKELETLEKKLSALRDQLNQTTMDRQLNVFSSEKNTLEKEGLRIQMEINSRKTAKEQAIQRKKELAETIKTTGEKITLHEKEIEKSAKQLKEAEGKYEKALEANQALIQKRERVQQKMVVEREKERAWQEKRFRIEGQVSEIKIEQSKYETRLEDVKQELVNYDGVELLEETDILELRKKVPMLEHEIKQLGTVNLKSLEDFSQYEKDVLDIREKSDTLEEERLAVLDLISGIDLKRNEVFIECFDKINENFNKLYTGFFEGVAHLSLTNPQQPLESGLIIEAKHGAEKSLKNIDSMSGGEKSLTSLAFIFAIQLYEPAPFYFFDEVDAALDMTNSRKVGELVHAMSKSSQFISITHNDSVVKVADQIIGVAKKGTASMVIGLKAGTQEERSFMKSVEESENAGTDAPADVS